MTEELVKNNKKKTNIHCLLWFAPNLIVLQQENYFALQFDKNPGITLPAE